MPIFECSQCNEMTYSATEEALRPCERCGSERQRVVEGDFDRARRTRRDLGPGDHAVLVHDDPAAVAPFCARFLGDGVARGERVFAGVPDDLRQAIGAELPAELERAIEWAGSSTFYGDFDAEGVASTWEALVLEEPRGARILAGLDRSRAEGVEAEELARYEAIAHGLITRLGATVLCAFDTTALPPALIEVAMRSHGLVIEDGGALRNELFEYQPV